MSLELIQNKILPQLLKNQVVKITLTGGEPLCNPQIKDIVQLLLDKPYWSKYLYKCNAN